MRNNNVKVAVVSEVKVIKRQINKIKKTPIVVPDGYKPIQLNAMRTSAIGTVDQPTIDGGMINASDGLKVIHEQSNNVIMPPPLPSKNKTDPLKNVAPFEDSWARSKEVRSVIAKAIQEGKLNYVMAESEKRGLPASIAIIPIVESKYSDSAVSPKGAAGLWQIMPSVARDYHIQDIERFDFKKSTQVALNHLAQLYSQFGNWELAYASYNAGSKRVLHALQQNPNAQSIDDLSLPLETKMYVTKIKSINQTLMSM